MIPQMFTPITNSQSPGGTSIILVPCIGTPALLQAIWSFPKFRSASASASRTDCSCVTSILTGMTRLLVPERPCAACSTASFWMSAMTTLAPASASAVAMPRPMPDAAPVTMAVLPEMSMCRGSFLFWRIDLFHQRQAFHREPVAEQILHALLQVFGEHQPRVAQQEPGFSGAISLRPPSANSSCIPQADCLDADLGR